MCIRDRLVAVYGSGLERLYANRMALDYQGVRLDEWRQMSVGSLTHPDDSERLEANWDHALASGAACEAELRLRKHDGTYRWFLARFTPMRDDEGQITRWYVCLLYTSRRDGKDHHSSHHQVEPRQQRHFPQSHSGAAHAHDGRDEMCIRDSNLFDVRIRKFTSGLVNAQ